VLLPTTCAEKACVRLTSSPAEQYGNKGMGQRRDLQRVTVAPSGVVIVQRLDARCDRSAATRASVVKG